MTEEQDLYCKRCHEVMTHEVKMLDRHGARGRGRCKCGATRMADYVVTKPRLITRRFGCVEPYAIGRLL